MRLSDAVERSHRLLHGMLPRQVDLTVDLSADPEPWVRANSTQIQQVVVNLAINARDAMPDGGPLDIRITSVKSPPPLPQLGHLHGKACACLEVRDRGCGIPPANLQRIFDPFFTTKPRERGTGLGLSLIHGIIKEHGGEIIVDSRVGEGTTFFIYLPRIEPQPEETFGRDVDGGSGTVLLLEDDVQIREIMAGMLEHLGCHVVFQPDKDGEAIDVVVAGSTEALAQAARGTPTVIIPPDGEDPPESDDDPSPVILTRPFRMADLRSAIDQARRDEASASARRTP